MFRILMILSVLTIVVAGCTGSTSETSSSNGGAADPHAGHAHAKKPEKPSDGYPLSECVVSGEELGSMGDPVVIKHNGQTVKFCCDHCVDMFKKNPKKYLAKLDAAK